MEDEELKELLKIEIPKSEKNFEKTLYECKNNEQKRNYKLINVLSLFVFGVIVMTISVFITMKIDNKKYDKNVSNIQNLVLENVDKGKSPYLAKDGIAPVIYNSLKKNNPDWEPVFDKMFAFGPEGVSSTIILDVIEASNLLNSEDKQTLLIYEENIKNTYPNHVVSFQIALGIRNDIDYIYLIDYCGYDNNLGKEVINTFIFKSNLDYSFLSIIDEFEIQIGKELTDEFLNSSYYDNQNALSSGIILGFTQDNDTYQEYYIVKLDGNVYLVSK